MDLYETLYAQQYSTNFGVYYDIVDPTVRSTKKLLISPTKSTFFLGKNFGGTRHPYEKNEPTLDHSGGVHGKACWLIY